MNDVTARAPLTGVSLTQDAWRRLRRNVPAMVALGTLVLVMALAALTPALPLQPPDRDLTKRAFTPPEVWPPVQPTFRFDPNPRGDLKQRIAAARKEVRRVEAEAAWFRELRARLERVDGAIDKRLLTIDDSQHPRASVDSAELLGELSSDADGAREELDARLATADSASRRARATLDSLRQRPYAEAGFPRLDPLARSMVRFRQGVFGEWEVASLCGRDKLGRCVLSRIFWGARVSLIVGLVATLVSLVIGVTYGAVSGYAGGWVDNLMMRVVDVLYSIPFVFLVIFLISVLSEESVKDRLAGFGIDRITIFYFVVGAIYWLTMARVVRGQVLSLRNEQYIEAAEALGVPRWGIVLRHLAPNLFSIVLVYLTLTIPRVILFEAFLSFLGLGVEPPDVSWGLLANEGIQVITPVRTYWWLIVFPSAALGATLFALNFLGDGLRDALDPRMKDR